LLSANPLYDAIKDYNEFGAFTMALKS